MIKGYHYTNPKNFRSMESGEIRGERGLIPLRRFSRCLGGGGLPEEAHESVIEGLLEPEPDSWINNPEFPGIWQYLFGDLFLGEEGDRRLILLSFDLLQSDRAYVVDRAEIERELYRKVKGLGESTRESIWESKRKFWESRTPVYNYTGGFSLPQLAVWNTIKFERLGVEWIKPFEEVRRRVFGR